MLKQINFQLQISRYQLSSYAKTLLPNILEVFADTLLTKQSNELYWLN